MEQNEGQMTELVSESTSANLAEPVSVEKQVPQSVVNRVVAEAKQSAYEQGRKSAATTSHTTTPVSGLEAPHSSNLTEDHIKKLVAEGIEQQNQAVQELQRQQAVQEFLVKLKPGEEKYADFNDTINSVNWIKVPTVLDLANLTENTFDVVYELAKNPQKAISLNNLAQVNPKAALAETQKLAESIKQNQRQPATARPPLSPLTPSVTGLASGSPSLRDKKENPIEATKDGSLLYLTPTPDQVYSFRLVGRFGLSEVDYNDDLSLVCLRLLVVFVLEALARLEERFSKNLFKFYKYFKYNKLSSQDFLVAISYNTYSIYISNLHFMTKKVSTKDSFENDKIVRITFDVPLSLRKAFKLKATADDKEMKQAFYELMRGYADGKFKLN